MKTHTALTAAELKMLSFPEGVSYDEKTGNVTAICPQLLKRAHGLLKLGAFNCRKTSNAIRVYGSTDDTHSGYGSMWLGSMIASSLRRKHNVIIAGSNAPSSLEW